VAVGGAGVSLGSGSEVAVGRDVVVGVGTDESVPRGGCALGAGVAVVVGVGIGVSVGCALGVGSGVAVDVGVSVPMGSCALGILTLEGDAKTVLGAAPIRQAARKPILITAMVRIQVFPVFKYILYSSTVYDDLFTWRPEHPQYTRDEPYNQPKNGQPQHREQDNG
jgi:hypothetical protein